MVAAFLITILLFSREAGKFQDKQTVHFPQNKDMIAQVQDPGTQWPTPYDPPLPIQSCKHLFDQLG